jgi:hypothetical protein
MTSASAKATGLAGRGQAFSHKSQEGCHGMEWKAAWFSSLPSGGEEIVVDWSDQRPLGGDSR